MIKTILKILLIPVGIIVLIFLYYAISFFAVLGLFEKDYSVTELKENFKQKESKIYELKWYFNSIVPKDMSVEIEFENKNRLSRFGAYTIEKGNPVALFLEWDVKINTPHADSLIKTLGWTRKTLEEIKEKLDNANCIGIENGEPAKIEFQRYGMGMYSFNVFDHPMSGSQKKEYSDSCTYILASDRLILEYGGGAIGTQCFYNKE